MQYKITIERLTFEEGKNYPNKISIYEQTIDRDDEFDLVQGIVAEINQLPKPL